MDAVRHLSCPALCVCPPASFPLSSARSLMLVLDIYHVSFPRERFAIVFSVYTIFALDVFQSIVVASEAWQTLCAGWGRPINLQFPGWTFTGLPIVSSVSE